MKFLRDLTIKKIFVCTDISFLRPSTSTITFSQVFAITNYRYLVLVSCDSLGSHMYVFIVQIFMTSKIEWFSIEAVQIDAGEFTLHFRKRVLCEFDPVQFEIALYRLEWVY